MDEQMTVQFAHDMIVVLLVVLLLVAVWALSEFYLTWKSARDQDRLFFQELGEIHLRRDLQRKSFGYSANEEEEGKS